MRIRSIISKQLIASYFLHNFDSSFIAQFRKSFYSSSFVIVIVLTSGIFVVLLLFYIALQAHKVFGF